MLLGLVLCLVGGVITWEDGYISIQAEDVRYNKEWSTALLDSIMYQDIEIYQKEHPSKKGKYFESGAHIHFSSINSKVQQVSWHPFVQICRFNLLNGDEVLSQKKWFVFLESFSDLRLQKLIDFLKTQDSEKSAFYGFGLKDKAKTDRHNYTGIDEDWNQFEYPDLSAGLVLSNSLIAKLNKLLCHEQKVICHGENECITIDAGYELAKFIYDHLNIRLTSVTELFCLNDVQKECAIYFIPPYHCDNQVELDELFVAVKTHKQNHRKRLNYIRFTWQWMFAEFDSSQFVSDELDDKYDTVTTGVPNVATGHCSKTIEILYMFLKHKPGHKWLMITDDDTLISPSAVLQLLSCYNEDEPVIIGERYGFNVNVWSKHSFDYPAGGAGIIFSRAAVKQLVNKCQCPKIDSPDDRIIGMCAKDLKIPIVHSSALHYWRPLDYPDEYLKKIPPASFHNFTDVDPLDVQLTYLEQKTNLEISNNEPKYRSELNWDNLLPLDAPKEDSPSFNYYYSFMYARELEQLHKATKTGKKAKIPQSAEIEPEIYFEDSFGDLPKIIDPPKSKPLVENSSKKKKLTTEENIRKHIGEKQQNDEL